MFRFFLAGLLALCVACTCAPPPTPEERILAEIEALIAGAQRADIGATLRTFSHRYEDDDGLSRDGIRGLLFRQFQRHGPITSILGPITVEFDDPALTAHASFDAVLMSGVSLLGPIPDQVEAWHFEVAFALEDDAWRITHHQRQRGLDATELLKQADP